MYSVVGTVVLFLSLLIAPYQPPQPMVHLQLGLLSKSPGFAYGARDIDIFDQQSGKRVKEVISFNNSFNQIELLPGSYMVKVFIKPAFFCQGTVRLSKEDVDNYVVDFINCN